MEVQWKVFELKEMRHNLKKIINLLLQVYVLNYKTEELAYRMLNKINSLPLIPLTYLKNF